MTSTNFTLTEKCSQNDCYCCVSSFYFCSFVCICVYFVAMWMWPKQQVFLVAAFTSLPLWSRPNTTTGYDSLVHTAPLYTRGFLCCVFKKSIIIVGSSVRWLRQTANTPRSMTWFSTAISK